MLSDLRTQALRHPEQIHPSLWRGGQLASALHPTVASGYPLLDRHLPGGGWPTGTLIELLYTQAGLGEIQLLKPALKHIEPGRSIVLLNPPYVPSAVCLDQWFGQRQPVLWIRPQTTNDTLWAAEKVLRHDSCAALLCWIETVPSSFLRRLHLAARAHHTLFFGFRPAQVATQISPAALRLRLQAVAQGLSITVLKRRGPQLPNPILLTLPSRFSSEVSSPAHHVALDQHLSTSLLFQSTAIA